MKINFTGKFKSLNTFESEDLFDFAIITGKNGSGKSQLLHTIQETYNQPTNNARTYSLKIQPTPTKVQIENLIYKNTTVSFGSIKPKMDQFINRFNSLHPLIKEFYALLYENNINIKSFLGLKISELEKLFSPKNLESYLKTILKENGFSGFGGISDVNLLLLRLHNLIQNDIHLFDILLIIKDFKNKDFYSVNKNDFYSTPIPEKYIDTSDLFGSQVEMIIHNYLKRRKQNDYENYRKERYNEQNNAIADDEFEKKYPAPWDIINRILKEHEIGIQIQEYKLKDYSEEMITEVKFYKSEISDFVSFQDLSSGEQVIISLILKLFTKAYYERELTFPDIFVLDEPDAYLHPEMSKLLIDVLYKSFVNDLGIKVILTTHSPSTVALSPEECIYELKNTPHCSLKKINKDEALNILTGVLPTLSIDYKNHKQIFLESPTDVVYFQNLFNKMNTEEKLNYKLYFISNEKGKSNCDWVKDIVNKLKDGGMSKVFGIIDWDGKNSSSLEVLVHGEGKRYSIENFLYDAIYLSVLFLEMNGANNIRKELIFSETYNQYNLANESQERLQQIWNWLIEKICKEFPIFEALYNEEILYYNGITVKIPSWYLKMKGHDLEEKLRKCFPSLSKYEDEGKLQKHLSIIMAKCYPFIPSESINIIKTLAQ
ncbi:MAG: AAA family ATPase [Ginsengibacter sp.]